MTDSQWHRTRLKYVADANVAVLPENTDAAFEFVYVDIGNVAQGCMNTDGHPIIFADAPSRARRLAKPGDSVVSTVRTYLRAVAIVPAHDEPLVFSTGFAVLSPLDGVDSRFLSWYLQGDEFVSRIEANSTGVSYPAITATQLVALGLGLPSFEEQRAIADYLDRETARIDTLIEEQQRLVEMLRERRFALRTHVALHGTTSAGEIESPLPWALMLPAHWRVVPLTSVADLESGHTPSRSRDDWWTDCYIPWVSLHDVGTMRGTKYLQDTAQHISDAGIANSSARLLPARTVVLSRDATVGRTAIMGIPMATSQHFAAWVCGPLLDPEYLWVLFQDAMQPFFNSFQNGSTIRTIGMGDLKAFRIPLPPLDEQRRVVAYLDNETAKIDALIAEAERFIQLSKERRSALITAAVTGQIDVREMA
jgi:type I restriction enzyme, S subunit